MEKLLTLREAAEMLRVHPVTLRRYIQQGKVEAFKTSRKWLLRESDLLKYLRNNRGDQ